MQYDDDLSEPGHIDMYSDERPGVEPQDPGPAVFDLIAEVLRDGYHREGDARTAMEVERRQRLRDIRADRPATKAEVLFVRDQVRV